MSGRTRLLLDKNVVRRYFEGASALARGLVLAEEEQHAVVLVHLAQRKGQQLFLPVEAYNLLQAHRHQIAPAETVTFLKRVEVLYHGRYFKRWARRLREETFTREDAKVLALGTFGTDEASQILGVHTENVYENALALRLRQAGFTVTQQEPIKVYFDGVVVGEYYADLVVNDLIILELKAVKELADVHEAQLLNYLKATPYEVGLLLNFGPKPQIVRKAYDNRRKPALKKR